MGAGDTGKYTEWLPVSNATSIVYNDFNKSTR